MIPLELLSMLTSTILGGVLSIMAQKSKDKADEQKMLMQRAKFQSEQFDKARDVQDPFTKNTRRWIALISVVSILVIPKLAPFIDPSMPIYVGYTETVSQGFWIFASDIDMTQWKPMTGLVITPLDTHVVSSIIGLYFGGSLVRR
jgi:hypothetical protein|tara:strand:- start:576 stop:1010 length:435 start_codon:yes stop_codon:yes gene_type:complete